MSRLMQCWIKGLDEAIEVEGVESVEDAAVAVALDAWETTGEVNELEVMVLSDEKLWCVKVEASITVEAKVVSSKEVEWQ